MSRSTYIPYDPTLWKPEGAQLHQAADLEQAFHHASCLSGGWYQRPVTIYMAVRDDNTEIYKLMPSDEPNDDPSFRPAYKVERLDETTAPSCATCGDTKEITLGEEHGNLAGCLAICGDCAEETVGERGAW